MCKGPSPGVALPPDVAKLMCGLDMPQALPVAWQPAGCIAGWVQEVQLAADAVPVPAKDQAAVTGEAGEEAVAVEVRAAGCCGWSIDCYDCEGCALKGEVDTQAASLWAAVLKLDV